MWIKFEESTKWNKTLAREYTQEHEQQEMRLGWGSGRLSVLEAKCKTTIKLFHVFSQCRCCGLCLQASFFVAVFLKDICSEFWNNCCDYTLHLMIVHSHVRTTYIMGNNLYNLLVAVSTIIYVISERTLEIIKNPPQTKH